MKKEELFEGFGGLDDDLLLRSEKKGKIKNFYRFVSVAACAVCFLSLSAFAYYKFNSLNGDDLVLSSVYLGEGKYEVIVTNLSEHVLKLQDKVKIQQWSTGEEIVGNGEMVHLAADAIPAGETEIIKIDLSKAYDVEQMQENISERDWYYFVLTNNSFAFGQDWHCPFDFKVKSEEEAIASHNYSLENIRPQETYSPQYEPEELAFEDWALPVKELRISSYFGKRGNDICSNHINVIGKEGDTIYAVQEGIVTDTGFDAFYGNYIVIAIDEQTTVEYGHLLDIAVSKGDRVKKNDVIGSMGNTGMSTGVNLSFAVNVDGEYVNPLK